jgi:hypothetical protein
MKKILLMAIIGLFLTATAYGQGFSGPDGQDETLKWYRYNIAGITATYANNLGYPTDGTGGITSTASWADAGSSGAGVSLTSSIINNPRRLGYQGLQIRIQGGGTASIRTLCSTDCTIFRPTDGTTYFKTGMTSTGGDQSDGRYYLTMLPAYASCYRLQITETGFTASVTPTAKLSKQ